MATSTTRRTKTHYQKLVSVKSNFCKGKATKADVKKAASAYIANAVKKATTSKTKAVTKTTAKVLATSKARKVLTSACKMSASIQGKKKVVRKKAAPKAMILTKRRKSTK